MLPKLRLQMSVIASIRAGMDKSIVSYDIKIAMLHAKATHRAGMSNGFLSYDIRLQPGLLRLG